LRRRLTVLIAASLIVAALSALAWLVLLAADIYGAPVGEVWRNGDAWTVASETRFGQVLLGRLGLAVALALTLSSTSTAPRRPLANAIGVVLATAYLIAPAWTGHAGAAPGAAGDINLGADALHLLAAGAWVGGLIPLAMLLAAAYGANTADWTEAAVIAVHRFSRLGIVSVGVLLASGLVNTWYDVGSVDALFSTTYGRLVAVKLGWFAAMVAIAAINKFYLTPRLRAAGAVGQLRRNSLTEAMLGFAAVLVVGFLGAMDPASHAHQHAASGGAIPADAAFVHIHSADGMADVTIMPGRVGTAHATVRLWNEDFQPLAASDVTLTLTAPTASSAPTRYSATLGDDGAWHVDAIALAQAGNWTVAVGAALGRGHRLDIAAPIVIGP
jgi:putative copper resistance protein D